MSAIGTKLPIQNVRFSVAIGGKADLHRTARFDAIDPATLAAAFCCGAQQRVLTMW
jgi:hypothetical protein